MQGACRVRSVCFAWLRSSLAGSALSGLSHLPALEALGRTRTLPVGPRALLGELASEVRLRGRCVSRPFPVIPFAVDGGTDAHKGGALRGWRSQNRRSCPWRGSASPRLVAPLPGLYEQLYTWAQIPAVLGVVVVDGRDGHQTLDPDVLLCGGSIQQGPERFRRDARLRLSSPPMFTSSRTSCTMPALAASFSMAASRCSLSTLWIRLARPSTFLILLVCKWPMKWLGLPQ